MGRIWMPGGGGGADLDVITAGAGDVLDGKVIVDKDGNPLTGTMPNRGAVSQELAAGGSYTVPAGYHNGAGVVTAKNLASQTGGTAVAADIRSNKTAWVNGVKLTGSMTEKAAATYTPKTTNQTIAAGQYLTGAQTIAGDSKLIAANIKKGVTIFGIRGTFEGWVPTAQDLYYNGVNSAGLDFGGFLVQNTQAVFNNSRENSYVNINFPSEINVQSYSSLIMEGQINTSSTYESSAGLKVKYPNGSTDDWPSQNLSYTHTYNSISINIAQVIKINVNSYLYFYGIRKGSYIKRIRLA